MSTVYIPNMVRRVDKGVLKSAFDFTKAASFGNLKEILGEFEDFLFVDRIVDHAEKALASFQDGDYLLAVGDPTVIAICSGILFRAKKKVNMLKWDRKSRAYIPLEISL